MMTIKFLSGYQRRIKADSAKIEHETLILLVYSKNLDVLHWGSTFPVKDIEWARLDNGTVLVGDSNRRFMD